MKKIFIAVIILAAAGSAFYLYKQASLNNQPNRSYKDLLIGSWTMDSVSYHSKDNYNILMASLLVSKDSNNNKQELRFEKDGKLSISRTDDSTQTSSYTWKSTEDIKLKPSKDDSLISAFRILLLDSSNLRLMSSDSISFYLKRKEDVIYAK